MDDSVPRTVQAPGRPQVRVTAHSGSITVVGEPRDDVAVDQGRLETADDGWLEIRPRGSATVRCPEGSDVVVGTLSGSLIFDGPLGEVRATTASGSVRVDRVSSLDARAVSGSIAVGTCTGLCRAKTKSGSVRVGHAGSAEITMGSGSVGIDHVDGAVRVRAVSGSVKVDAEGHGRVDVETMSGSVTITLPEECRPSVQTRSLTGRRRVECPHGDDCEVCATTLSGGITVRPR
jgi:hypothetical protein